MPPTEEATIERSFSLVNEAMHTVALQRRRIAAHLPEDDDEFIMRPWADWGFFVIALWRLRRCSLIACRTRFGRVEVRAAIDVFDAALPDLKLMRDVSEHIDAYAVDSPKRHRLDVSRRELQVGGWTDSTFTWQLMIGDTGVPRVLDADVAFAAAEALYREVRAARDRASAEARD